MDWRRAGSRRLPQGGFVLAANHVSNFDPWPLGLPLLPRRWLRFMAKSELYWWPLTPVLDAGGAFKVRRGAGDIEAIETAVELVRDGEIVVMFPEGTRRKRDSARRGRRARTPAPRALRTARAAARSGGDQGHRSARHVSNGSRSSYGEPFNPGDDARVATDRLMSDIEKLYAEL